MSLPDPQNTESIISQRDNHKSQSAKSTGWRDRLDNKMMELSREEEWLWLEMAFTKASGALDNKMACLHASINVLVSTSIIICVCVCVCLCVCLCLCMFHLNFPSDHKQD